MQTYAWKDTEVEVLEHLEVTRHGLSKEEAAVRLQKYGPNELAKVKKVSRWGVFFNNFKSPLIYILLIAGLASLIFEKPKNAVVILTVVLINALIGYFEEQKAEKTIDALKKLSALSATVIRDGESLNVVASQIVPGDIVVLAEGAKVPADGRLIEAHSLQLDESVLTGESTYVDKYAHRATSSSAMGVNNLVYMGTSVVTGRGHMVVTDTGKNTEFGKITKMVEDEFNATTPLQKKLAKFSRQLGIGVIGVCLLVFILGIASGVAPLIMLETAISLAVSAIPEGLPVAITITLVLGMKRMAKKKAIIRRLSAVETLGTTTIIASDKTGTLTHNKLMVTSIFTGQNYTVTGEGYGTKGLFLHEGILAAPSEHLRFLLLAGALANDGKIKMVKKGVEIFGDPTDCALLVAAEKFGLKNETVDEGHQRIAELPFSSDRKLAAVLTDSKEGKTIFVKGAYEEILKRSSSLFPAEGLTEEKLEHFKAEAKKMTSQGLRVIGIAYKKVPSAKKSLVGRDVSDLTFVGLAGMKDTYRLGAKKAIEVCKRAGIKIIMLTGDHLETAKTIGRDLGILKSETQAVEATALEGKGEKELARIIAQTTVFARIRPDTKFKIIEALKGKGEIVAMTGDGVNDAPALSKADIGIAMGVAGTDAAKESADMILVDDNFSTIVTAVEEGRTIFENIRKTLFYLISTSLGEVMAVLFGLVAGLPIILTPLQILWINMVTDTSATIPLGMEPTEKNHLKVPPRKPGEAILSLRMVIKSLLVGLFMAGAAIYLFYKYLPQGEDYARTVAFTLLVVVQWLNALNARSEKSSIFALNPFSNPALILGIGMAVLSQILVMVIPALRSLFGLSILSGSVLLEVVMLSFGVIFVVELEKLVVKVFLKSKVNA